MNRLARRFAGDDGNNVAATRPSAPSAKRFERTMLGALERAGAFVAAHPGVCLGAAAAAGIAIGWWVKRR